jgi:hypothetical protein
VQQWRELAETVRGITDEDFSRTVAAIPTAWGPPDEDRTALVAFLVRRRRAVVTVIEQHIADEEAKQ